MKNLTDSNFDTEISGKTCLVKFTADWCGPCKAIMPALTKLEESGYLVFEVDTETEAGITERYGIRSLPTVVGIKDGVAIDQIIGAVPEAKLVQWAAQLK